MSDQIFMTTRYLVSSMGYCLCDTSTQETLLYTHKDATKAVAHLTTKGIEAIIIKIQYK